MALPKTPPIETSNVSEARRQFSETLDRVRRHEARVVVEKSGIPVGAIVSMDDLKIVEKADADRNRLIEIMERISKNFEGIPQEELDREVFKADAAVKAKLRQRRAEQAVDDVLS